MLLSSRKTFYMGFVARGHKASLLSQDGEQLFSSECLSQAGGGMQRGVNTQGAPFLPSLGGPQWEPPGLSP